MRDANTSLLIADAYDAVGNIELWPVVLDRFRIAVGADAIVQFSIEVDPGTARRAHAVRSTTSIGLRTADAERHAQFAPISPLGGIVPSLPIGSCHAVYDLIRRDDFENSFFYDQCVRPTGMTDALFGTLAPLGPDMTTLNLMRAGPASTSLFKSELPGANLVMAHLARVFRLNLKLARMGMEMDGMLSSMLESVTVAMLCVGTAGNVLCANARAEALLALDDGIVRDRTGHLSCSTSRNIAALIRLIHQAGSGIGSCCGIERPSGRLDFALIASPFGDRCAEDARRVVSARSRPAAIIAIHEPDATADESELAVLQVRLRQLFGLTPAEAAVAASIHVAPGLRATAERLGIGRPTVQTHLHRVFDKMQIGTQGELTRLLQALTVT